ncbi:hypothetical protein MTHERMOG20_10710 [Moorella thermoacetica]|nr:hypothetical protein MOTHE_c17580 [Moorella thermoacetica]AKX97187.1 hypothetical protein MOTHA_c18410 [Moorella thermoacetica]OIQ57394.1 hypothetical protein MOCA_09840 [Moorella thermoacetica]OIQ62909.1 hypothetical protein MTIN_03760 [Moorella thermoacetica]QDA01018.1 hypothetical protein MothHH_01879 [Moorella thermoacetica]
MEQVGIRKMKTSLSHYIKRVKQGESFIITEREVLVGSEGFFRRS